MIYPFNNIVVLSKELKFPSPLQASEEGLLAMGGDLSIERLLLAYKSGIFPWYNLGNPILWWSPNPRMVLYLDKLKVSKSLRKKINSNKFRISFNTSFPGVISNCASLKRKEEEGTWINSQMKDAYIQMHKFGHALSVEVWEKDQLVGGLYGVDLPEQKVFCGESMFSTVSDASKIALYFLVEHLKKKKYRLIDCQIHSEHLERLGAEQISRARFLNVLNGSESR